MEELKKAVELTCSVTGMEGVVGNAMEFHLQYLHRARQILIRRMLPPAAKIVDLGGANAPLYRMGYKHRFERLAMVDLPPEGRHAAYADAVVDAALDYGEVVVHWSDMTRLPGIPDASVDLVWSGQSIEHVDLEGGKRMCREAWRILKPGGWFCLDTPNRALTSIHTRGTDGGFIHPDHRHEYYADELRTQLKGCGFEVVDECGVCEMPNSVATNHVDYSDFILGNPISDKIEASYILYFACRKPSTGVMNRSGKIRAAIAKAFR
jgi:SAM-dependent methyltransferase